MSRRTSEASDPNSDEASHVTVGDMTTGLVASLWRGSATVDVAPDGVLFVQCLSGGIAIVLGAIAMGIGAIFNLGGQNATYLAMSLPVYFAVTSLSLVAPAVLFRLRTRGKGLPGDLRIADLEGMVPAVRAAFVTSIPLTALLMWVLSYAN